jgi:AcrR family transcriptional regulator
VFLEKGYHSATMDDIARRAGMSKKTIYVVFPSKAELYDALLSERLEQYWKPIPDDDRPMAQALCEFLLEITQATLSPRKLALTRLMIAESPRSPEVVQALKRQPICRGEGSLDDWIVRQVERGKLVLRDSREASAMLLGMTVGEMLLGQLVKVHPPRSKAEVARRIEGAVEMFLLAHQVKKRKKSAAR